MKKIILSLSFFLFAAIAMLRGQQASVQIVLNPIGNCRVQVEYWLKNNTMGTGNMQIAVSNAVFQWDSTLFTLVRDSSTTSTGTNGSSRPGLNGSDFFPGYPDADIFGTRSIYGTNFRTLDIQRSTNDCDSLYIIDNQQSKPLGLIVLQFRDCSQFSLYNYSDTTAPNFIADVNDGTHDPSPARKILAIVNNQTRSLDQSGKPCKPGTDFTNTNPVPAGDTSNTYFIPQAPLANIKIKSFGLVSRNNHANLVWETEGELNSLGFEVQRKLNNEFKTIGFVYSKANDGNKNEIFSYTFTDPDNLNNGSTYYRLRQVNKIGVYSYSEIKAISNSKVLQVLVYPNPNRGVVNIIVPDGNGTTDINMIDFSGKLIRTWTGYKIPNIELSGLQKGIYTLLISNRETGEKVAQKITVE